MVTSKEFRGFASAGVKGLVMRDEMGLYCFSQDF